MFAALKVLVMAGIASIAAMALAGDVVEGERGQKIDRYLTRQAEDGFSGVILAAQGGKLVIAKGYGLADQENEVPFTPDTPFSVGSLTKQFTAAAILKLEMQDKLRVTDKVSKYFDNVPPDKQSMTLHHLLTHSSGLKSDFGRDYDPMTRKQIIKQCMESELLWPPGTRYRYSNAGYSLLAAIIEQLTGDSYERYLHDQLFQPAGMMSTGYKIPKWDRAKLAHGYLRDGKDWGTMLDHRWDSDGPYWNLRGNGGIMSTAKDMFRWHQALNGNQILSDEAKRKYFTAHVREEPASTYYGYGWVVVDRKDKGKVLWHDGSNGVFFADAMRYLDDDVFLLMASNRADRMIGQHKTALVNMVR